MNKDQESSLNFEFDWRSILHVVPTTLAISVAFMLGQVYSLGLGFLPLIDKVELLLLMSIYISTVFIIIRFMWLYLSVFDWTIMRNVLPQQAPRKNSKIFISIAIGACIFLLCGLIIFQNSWYVQAVSYIGISINEVYDARLIYRTIFVLLATLSLTFIILLGKLTTKAFVFPMIKVVLALSLPVSYFCGSAWIEYLELKQPDIILHLDEQIKHANLVAQSDAGLLVFVMGQNGIQFVPWEKVDRIKIAGAKNK